MRLPTLEAIFRALNGAQAEYLVVGGVAVMAHGYVRLTQDLDLVLNLSSERLIDGLKALQKLGYRPRIPVDILAFANRELRESWRKEKGMIVFNVFSDAYPDVTIDIFPAEPFVFAEEYARAKPYPVRTDLIIPVVCLDRLIRMKSEAGRPQDLLDVDKLSKLRNISDET